MERKSIMTSLQILWLYILQFDMKNRVPLINDEKLLCLQQCLQHLS